MVLDCQDQGYEEGKVTNVEWKRAAPAGVIRLKTSKLGVIAET